MNKSKQSGAYAESAYNSQCLTKQAQKPAQGFLRKLLSKGRHFRFTLANASIALSAIGETTPSAMAEMEADKTKLMYWNETTLTSEAFSGWSQLYFIVVGLAKVSLIGILPLFYFIFIFGILYAGGGWDLIFEMVYGLSLYALLPCLLIYGHFKLVGLGHLYLAPFIKGQLLFELNRQTGMVTLFKKGNKVRFSHPFIEFDCVLISAPTPQGHLNYSLALVHRYQAYSVGVPLQTLVGTDQTTTEYATLWNMIQRYMDTSQPMPDIMILEPARAHDPITAEYDAKHARNPRYWRDMTDEAFKQAIERMREKQKGKPTSGPVIDIFKQDKPQAS